MSGSQTSSRSSSIDLPTLLVTAAASAIAAYVTSKIWAPGTLGAAAFTPVLIAVLKEALYKPAEVVTRAVPVRGVVRSASSADEPARPAEPPAGIEERIAQPGEARGVSRPVRQHSLKIAITTGLLGFLLAAVIITVPELVAGSSASGGGRETTFFGGGNGSSSDPADTTTTTIPEEDETDGVPPASTVTVPPPAETITVPPPAPVPDGGAAPPPEDEEESPEGPAPPASPQPPPPPR